MAVTKEKVFQNLKAKLGNTQKISDRSINETLETLIGSALETEDDTVFTDRIFPIFDTFNRNLIKDNSDAIQEYILKNPAAPKAQSGQTTQPKSDDNKTDLSEMQKTLAEIAQKLKEQELQKTLETKRSQLRETLIKTHKIDEKWAGEYVSMFPLTETDDITSTSQKALEFYNLSIANATNPDGTPKGAGGQQQPINIQEEFRDIIEQRKTT